MSTEPGVKEKVGLTKKEITYIARQQNVNYDQLLILIKNVLETTLKNTILELEIWINSKVAKRTGHLREDLIEHLHNSYIKLGLLRLILGSDLRYADRVAKMTQSMVRHTGQIGYAKGHPGPIVLYDPQAVGFFWDKLLVYAKERIRINLVKAKNEHLGIKGKMVGALRRAIV